MSHLIAAAASYRMVSSYHEIGGGTFTEIVKGQKAKLSQNPHYLGQFFTASRATGSGRGVRLDYIAHLEDMAEGWERLKPVLTPAAVTMSPIERRKLIPDHAGTSKHIKIFRDSSKNHATDFIANSSIFLPRSSSDKFRQLHVILTCRRYIQDLVCFDLPIPRVCIEHPELIFDL